ncbi:hypothetical protein N7501_003242 [Penicillium viridicatum]|nr:hypothetical protein N7501_003242 [Penicillium viridicatum]
MGHLSPCPRLLNPASISQTAKGACLAEAAPPPVVSISIYIFGKNPRNSEFTLYSNSPNLTIANIASGTAIWLLDVAHSLPTATIHGYDIDLSNTPPTPTRPV